MNVGSIVQIGGAIKHTPLPPLVASSHTNLDDDEDQVEKSSCSRNLRKSVIGGFIGDGKVAWRASGPTIEVFDPLSESALAAWTFRAFHKSTAKVTCVCGIGVNAVSHIAVGVNLGPELNMQGMVGILSLKRSRIIRAFQFKHKVSSICMVTGGEKLVDSCTLAPELRSFQGLIAVATSNASLYLLDLGLDLGDEITSDENSPASLVTFNIPDSFAEQKRREAIARRYHPIVCLSDVNNNGQVFRLLGMDDSIVFEAPSATVSATSMMFVPQLASLIIGFNFGSFQIFNLNQIIIDCASSYEENLAPVFSFAYQEPENDPRSYVYMWVCRSVTAELIDDENDGDVLVKSSCSLFSMSYDKKEWIEGHGLWYQGLTSVTPKFDFDVVGGIGERVESLQPSRIISVLTVYGTTPSTASTPLGSLMDDALSSSTEDSDPVPEMSLCLFFWESSVLNKGTLETRHYIAIFDINQWYQSQIPSRLRLEENTLCPYMSFHCLDKVPKSINEVLLSGSPKKGSWSRHHSRTHCEKMWFPSSLSYEFNLLTSEGLVTYRCASVQQSAITNLVQMGPGAIVSPHDIFNMCAFSGLIPSAEITSQTAVSIMSGREQLLNTALEYHLLSLLVQCVQAFSEGRFAHLGCSLQLMLDWAWKQLTSIKTSSDSICATLFALDADVSTVAVLSSQDLATLHQNLSSLSHLSTVITAIRNNAGQVTSLSAVELEGRVQVVNLLHLHLQVTLWFYHCGLLPQCSAEEEVDERLFPFPSEALQTIYKKRRDEIHKLNMTSDGFQLLLIDSIVEDCGPLLSDIWGTDKESGRVAYPPPSLHALLSIYLLPNLPTHTKHRIVQHLFLDLAELFPGNYSNVFEELIKFPSSFSLSPSLIKLTQAFWLIDNKYFSNGLSVLLDPLVVPGDITLKQYRRIIKAFLYQDKVTLALAFTQIRSSPKFEPEDVELHMSLLLANGRIREAFHFQRKYRLDSTAQDLLQKFFKGCEKLGRLENVVHFPLSPLEESVFITFLHRSRTPGAHDILLVYFLQQSRYDEICTLSSVFKRKSSVKNQGDVNTRFALVKSYATHLPDMKTEENIKLQKTRPSRTLYNKPQPLSARIRQSSNALQSPNSKSALFRPDPGRLSPNCKARLYPFTPFRSKAQRRKAVAEWEEEVGLFNTNGALDKAHSIMDTSHIILPSNVSTDVRLNEAPNALVQSFLTADMSLIETPLRIGVLGKSSGKLTLMEEDISKVIEECLKSSKGLSSKSGASGTPGGATLGTHGTSFVFHGAAFGTPKGDSFGTIGSALRIPGAAFGTPDQNHNVEDPYLSSSKVKLSKELLSLLKTPPVKQRSMGDRSIAGNEVHSSTPQSILKVRKMLEQSHSESPLDTTPSPFPCARTTSLRSTSKTSQEKAIDEPSICLTPKQLRFDLSSTGRRISAAGSEVVEEEEEKKEELETVEKRRKSLRHSSEKRKRSPTPPSPSSSPSQPRLKKSTRTELSSSPEKINKSSLQESERKRLTVSEVPESLVVSVDSSLVSEGSPSTTVSKVLHSPLVMKGSPVVASEVSKSLSVSKRSPSPRACKVSQPQTLSSVSDKSRSSSLLNRSPSPASKGVSKHLFTHSDDSDGHDDSFHSADDEDPCQKLSSKSPVCSRESSPVKKMSSTLGVSVTPNSSPLKKQKSTLRTPSPSTNTVSVSLPEHSPQGTTQPPLKTPEHNLSLSERVDGCLQNISIIVSEAHKTEMRAMSISPRTNKIENSSSELTVMENEKTMETLASPLVEPKENLVDPVLSHSFENVQEGEGNDAHYNAVLSLSIDKENDLFKRNSGMSIEEFAHQYDTAVNEHYAHVLEFSFDTTQETETLEPTLTNTETRTSSEDASKVQSKDQVESVSALEEDTNASKKMEKSPQKAAEDPRLTESILDILKNDLNESEHSIKEIQNQPVSRIQNSQDKSIPKKDIHETVETRVSPTAQPVSREATPLRRSTRNRSSLSTPIAVSTPTVRRRKASGTLEHGGRTPSKNLDHKVAVPSMNLEHEDPMPTKNLELVEPSPSKNIDHEDVSSYNLVLEEPSPSKNIEHEEAVPSNDLEHEEAVLSNDLEHEEAVPSNDVEHEGAVPSNYLEHEEAVPSKDPSPKSKASSPLQILQTPVQSAVVRREEVKQVSPVKSIVLSPKGVKHDQRESEKPIVESNQSLHHTLDSTPMTPLRRSSRRRSSVSTPVEEPPTPSRRRRKLSETSDAGDVSSTKTPSKGRVKKVETVVQTPQKETPLRETRKCKSPIIEDEEHITQAHNQLEVIGTSKSERKDTPRRRSTRKSLESTSLESITEALKEPSSPAPSSTPSKSAFKRTPQGRGRKSIGHVLIPMEPLLETIKEDSEISNNSAALETPVGVTRDSPAPSLSKDSTPLRRSRRRSGSLNKSPEGPLSTSPQNKEEIIPVARRTRRASASSNASETSPPRTSPVASTLTSQKSRAADSSALEGESSANMNYIRISPLYAAHQRRSLYSMSVVSTRSRRSSASSTTASSVSLGRRSIKSLPLASIADDNTEGTPAEITAAAAGRRKTRGFSSSVLVISKTPEGKNSDEDDDEFEMGDENVFVQPEEDVSMLPTESTVSPSPASPSPVSPSPESPSPASPSPPIKYKLIDGPKVNARSLILRRKIKRAKSSSRIFRRGLNALTVQTPPEVNTSTEDFGEATKKGAKSASGKPKKAQTKTRKRGYSREGVDKSVIVVSKDESKPFTFKEPDEVVSTAEAISEAFRQLTEKHAQMVSESFVFSPPFRLNENKRRKKKTK